MYMSIVATTKLYLFFVYYRDFRTSFPTAFRCFFVIRWWSMRYVYIPQSSHFFKFLFDYNGSEDIIFLLSMP